MDPPAPRTWTPHGRRAVNGRSAPATAGARHGLQGAVHGGDQGDPALGAMRLRGGVVAAGPDVASGRDFKAFGRDAPGSRLSVVEWMAWSRSVTFGMELWTSCQPSSWACAGLTSARGLPPHTSHSIRIFRSWNPATGAAGQPRGATGSLDVVGWPLRRPAWSVRLAQRATRHECDRACREARRRAEHWSAGPPKWMPCSSLPPLSLRGPPESAVSMRTFGQDLGQLLHDALSTIACANT